MRSNISPRPRFRRVVLLVTAMVAVGCTRPTLDATPPPPATPTVAPVELPRAVLPDGFTIRLELAMTPEEVANGLMFRPSLPADRGMLFLFDQQHVPSFWMKNTLIPLDLIFLDPSGSVVDVVADVPPCSADPCPTYSPKGPALAVLELGAGRARTHGIVPGATLSFERVPGYPRANEELGIRN